MIRETEPAKSSTSAGQFGLAIASLVIGVLLAVATIPSALLAGISGNGLIVAIAVCPFALIAGVFGLLGKSSALGIAGLALSSVALAEAGGMIGYGQYERYRARQKFLEIERRQLAAESIRVEAENARRERAEIAAAESREREALWRAQLEEKRKAEARAAEQENDLARQSVSSSRSEPEPQPEPEPEPSQPIPGLTALNNTPEDASDDPVEEQIRRETKQKMDSRREQRALIRSAETAQSDLESRQAELRALTQSIRRTEADLSSAVTSERVAVADLQQISKRVDAINGLDPRPSNYLAAIRECESRADAAQTRKFAAERAIEQYRTELLNLRRREASARAAVNLAQSAARSAKSAAGETATGVANLLQTPAAIKRIYQLRDGRTIRAVKIMAHDDVLNITDDAGQTITISRLDVESESDVK